MLETAALPTPLPAAPGHDARQLRASFRGAPHAFVDVGHSRLAYRRFGRGPDLVFVHGWPLHSGTFRALVPLLACFQELAHIDGEFHELFIEPLLRSREIAARQFELVRRLDVGLVDRLGEVHRRIQAPTLLVWGERDPIFPLEKARAMLPQFGGGARLEVLAGGKTFVHEEQPAALVAHARPFLLDAFGSRAHGSG